MIFESHAHYDDEAFDTDRDELLPRLRQQGIGYVMNISSDISSVSACIALAEKYPFVYAAAGIHPDDTGELNEDNFEWLKKQCGHKKVLAVGEIGLDYYWDNVEREVQKKWFARQLALANEMSLPVVIHSRDAAKDTLDIMKAEKAVEKRGVIHCFSYTKESAREFLAMGYLIGVGGVVTFQNAKKLRECVAYVPMDRILLETDSPYLAPVPYRGKRNCSGYLPYVAEKIAEIKGISGEEVIEVTEKNAKRLFMGNEDFEAK
ncbi:MAG: TatD family hydrolase [Lachnospiraceae bacterium]|jgi:TatD DNase family protein|nr:TatD family hydrolase [Lachnospiraceae bacterium]